jgi:hypothetical protein
MSKLPFEDRIDPRMDTLLAEIATRESYYLFESVFDEMQQWVYKELLAAASDEDRLSAQAYARVVDGLRKRIRRHKSKLEKERPIVIGQR